MNSHTDGQQVLKAISQARGLMEQIALLLKTADEQMKELGWGTAGNYCITGASTSLLYPKYWMPYYVFRFYKQLPFLSRLVALSVILDDESNERQLVEEPIVSGIVFDYGSGSEVGVISAEQWTYASWHVYMPGYLPDRRNDGSILVCVDPAKAWPKYKCTAKRIASFGFPLLDISSSTDLLTKVVKPLDSLARASSIGE